MEKLFQPGHCNVEWLLDRFAKFLEKKIKVDACAHKQKNKHAPEGNVRVIYRELGRDNIDSMLLLHESEKTVERYVELVCRPEIRKIEAAPITKLCIQRGIVGEMISMVEALQEKEEDMELLCNVLRLIECLHITYFCSEEYEANCCEENKWMVGYLSEATKNICMNRTDFEMAFANCGFQMSTLLKKVAVLVASSGIAKCRDNKVRVWHTRRRRIGHMWSENVPMGLAYEIQAKQKSSKVQIRKIPTTYVSSILSTVASPMPEVPLPACTGSMAM